MLLLARIVRLVTGVIAAIIVAGILLFVLGANRSNAIVEWVMDAGEFLVGPFDSLFKIDNANWEIAVNWGIAAAVWLIAGALVARLLAALSARGGAGWGRRRAV